MSSNENLIEYEHVKFTYLPDLSLAEQYFKPSEDPMFPDKYKNIMTSFAGFCELKKPKNLLINMKDKSIMLEEDLQLWLKNEIYPRLANAGAIRKGYLIPNDFHSQLSIADSAKNSINSELIYFETRESALKWFLAQVSDPKMI